MNDQNNENKLIEGEDFDGNWELIYFYEKVL
jgi:hypothetical protein